MQDSGREVGGWREEEGRWGDEGWEVGGKWEGEMGYSHESWRTRMNRGALSINRL